MQILSIAPNEVLTGLPRRAGDRWVFAIRSHGDDPLERNVDDPFPVWKPRGRLVSVDACGDDPQTIVDDVLAWSRHHTDHGTLWLACSQDTGQLWRFDPMAQEPLQSFGLVGRDMSQDGEAAYKCHEVLVTNDAVILRRPNKDGVASLVRVALSDHGPDADEVLGDGRWLGTSGTPAEASAVLVWKADGSVVSIDIGTGVSSVVVVTTADQSAALYAGRYIGVLDPPPTSSLRLHDLRTGAQLDVHSRAAPIFLPSVSRKWEVEQNEGLLRLQDDDGSHRLMWLPEMEIQAVGGTLTAATRVGADAVVFWVRTDDGTWDTYTIDAPGAEPRLLLEGAGPPASVDTSGIIAPDTAHPYLGGNAPAPHTETSVDWLSLPLDGSEGSVVVHDVFDPRRLTGGDWVTVRGYGEALGELLVVDADGNALGRVDRDVSPALEPWRDRSDDAFAPQDGVMYFVGDEARRGLWYAEPE